MTETVGQLFELLKNTNVGQLFELPKTQMQFVGLFFLFLETQDQTSWEVGWTSQDHNPKTLGSCLNFPKLLTETVEQFFELPKTRVENLWDIDWTSRDWKSGIVVWISKDPVRKPLGSCLVFSRLQVLGSYMNCLRTQMICSCLSFPRLKVLGIFLSFPRTQVLGSCLNFPKPESKTVRQMFEVIKTQDRNSWSVVWASQEQKSWAGVWTSQDKLVEQLFELPKTNLLCNCLRIPRPQVLGRSSYFPRLKTKYVENLVELCRTRDRIGWSIVWTFQDHTPKRLGSCLNFPKLLTETIGQLFDVFQIQGRTRWAVVWTSEDPCPKPLGDCLNFPRLQVWGSSLTLWTS